MKKNFSLFILSFFLIILSVPLLSGCSSGSISGDVTVKYKLEFLENDPGCLRVLEYTNDDGEITTRHSVSSTTWTEVIGADADEFIYFFAEIDCGEIEAKLYLDGDQQERERDSYKIQIQGHVRIDEYGNSYFEPTD